MNILIPMAGRGSRFKQQGYTVPKPFIDVAGKPMVVRVIENVEFPDSKFILIILREHLKFLHLLDEALSNFTIIITKDVTEGAACTCLLAERYINSDEELLIANCDQLEDWNKEDFDDFLEKNEPDGCILTFDSTDLKNSFARVGNDGCVIETAEKKLISNLATTGIYYWRQGFNFIDSAKDMIMENDRTNGEFYVCPTFNYLCMENRILTYHIKNHIPIGTPEDLRAYLKTIY